VLKKRTKFRLGVATVATIAALEVAGPVYMAWKANEVLANYNDDVQKTAIEEKKDPEKLAIYNKYNGYVQKIANEILDMNLPDDFSKIIAIRCKMAENGYQYGEDNTKSIAQRGLAVAENKGVYRDVAFFEKDVAHLLGLNPDVVCVKMNDNPKPSNINKRFGKWKATAKDFVKGLITLPLLPAYEILTNMSGNHAIVRYDNVTLPNERQLAGLYSDSTNPSFLLRVKDTDKLYSLNSGVFAVYYTIAPLGEGILDAMEYGGKKDYSLAYTNEKLKNERNGDGTYTLKEIRDLKNIIGLDIQNKLEDEILGRTENIQVADKSQ